MIPENCKKYKNEKKKQRMDINNTERSHLEVENGKELVQIWSRKFYSKFPVDWEDFLKIDELSIENSTEMYLDKFNMLLDTYASLKRILEIQIKI